MQTDELTATGVRSKAHARGARTYVLDGAANTDRESTIDAIAVALAFPDPAVRDLDALYDRLTDLSWLPAGEHVLIWVASDTLKRADPRAYLAIRGVLSDSQRALAAGDGKANSHTLTLALTET